MYNWWYFFEKTIFNNLKSDVLHELNLKHNFSERNYLKMRDQVRDDIYKYMITERDGNKIFCYTTDLKDGFEFYHDANDLPFALLLLYGTLSMSMSRYSGILLNLRFLRRIEDIMTEFSAG